MHRALSPGELHQALVELTKARVTPGSSGLPRAARLDRERELALLEERFLEEERRAVAPTAAEAPHEARAFVRWFDALLVEGPGQDDPLFAWLERHASWGAMRWFLRQEVAGEAGFDDLVALTQLRMPNRVKLEMARNYWDEMGRGRESAMHSRLLDHLAASLAYEGEGPAVVWQAVALGNLMAGLALDRRYAFHSVGALGAVELSAPDRSAAVNRGLARLGVRGHERQYYALHATLDRKHYRAWRDEVLSPLVEEDPTRARPLAEGALMRLSAGARCFERYREALWGHRSTSSAPRAGQHPATGEADGQHDHQHPERTEQQQQRRGGRRRRDEHLPQQDGGAHAQERAGDDNGRPA